MRTEYEMYSFCFSVAGWASQEAYSERLRCSVGMQNRRSLCDLLGEVDSRPIIAALERFLQSLRDGKRGWFRHVLVGLVCLGLLVRIPEDGVSSSIGPPLDFDEPFSCSSELISFSVEISY